MNVEEQLVSVEEMRELLREEAYRPDDDVKRVT